MTELMQIGAGAVAGTVASIVALLPRKWLPATIVAGFFVPLLAVFSAAVVSRAAFGGLSGETSNAVGELDLWLLCIALFDTVAALLCLGRVLLGVKAIATSHALNGPAP